MYKYTIKPEILKAYREKKFKKWYSERLNWRDFIAPMVKLSTSDTYRERYVVPLYLDKTYTFYSTKKRQYVPVLGYLVQVHGLFQEQIV